MNSECCENYIDLSWQLAKNHLCIPKSSCISPVGIWTLLAAVYGGSQGKTKAEIARVLFPHARVSAKELMSDAGFINQKLHQLDAISTLRNSIGVGPGITLIPGYEAAIRAALGNTLQIIPSDKALVLKNEVHFSDTWENKFTDTQMPFYRGIKESASVTAALRGLKFGGLGGGLDIFTSANKKSAEIPFIIPSIKRSEVPTAYTHTNSMLSATIPFASSQDGKPIFCVVISMPEGKSLEKYLTKQKTFPDELKPIIETKTGVNLFLPSFTVENQIPPLNATLLKMGINEAFNKENANISKMANKRLYIKSAEQEAQIKITAEGAKAFAKTTFSLCATIGMIPPSLIPIIPNIVFDHPFFFSLWLLDPVKIPLFIGTFQGD